MLPRGKGLNDKESELAYHFSPDDEPESDVDDGHISVEVSHLTRFLYGLEDMWEEEWHNECQNEIEGDNLIEFLCVFDHL